MIATEMNPRTIKISHHSIIRYRERSGNKGPDNVIERQLRKALCFSKEVQLKPYFKINVLLDHRGEDTQYFKYERFIFVIANGELKTVHCGTADRWY